MRKPAKGMAIRNGRWPPNEPAAGSQIFIIIIRAVVPAAASVSVAGIGISVAIIVAEEHWLGAVRAVVDGDDASGFDFGYAAARINQLRAPARIGHDEITLARFSGGRHALKALAMIDENLTLDGV